MTSRQADLLNDNVDRELLLVKVPACVAKAWLTADGDAALGTVILSEEKMPIGVKIPSLGQYDLAPMPFDEKTLSVFSHDRESIAARPAVEGRVVQKFILCRQGQTEGKVDAAYHAVLKQRRLNSEAKTAKAIMLLCPPDVDDDCVHVTLAPKKAKKSAPRQRMDKDELESALFAMFEERPALTLKDMQATTEQPTEWLKSVVSGIAQRRKSGNTFVWSLGQP